jgi:hypothetical protein
MGASMADGSYVHLQEASFWIGLFLADRGLKELLPAKIARGWIHTSAGLVGIAYGLGYLSGSTVQTIMICVGIAIVIPAVAIAVSRRGLWKSALVWLWLLRPEQADWRPLTRRQKGRLRDVLIAIGRHSILIEHNPNSDCVSFAYDLAHLFKDSGWCAPATLSKC